VTWSSDTTVQYVLLYLRDGPCQGKVAAGRTVWLATEIAKVENQIKITFVL
jgi:hypothetical protein